MGGKITIIGCGPGSPDLLTVRGKNALEKAEVIVGSKRLLEDFADKKKALLIPSNGCYKEAMMQVENLLEEREVAVLVSGDPLFHSFGESVIKKFGPEKCEVIPGISSFQYAFSRLKESWKGYSLFSLHGDDSLDIKRIFEENNRFVLLLDPKHNLKYLAKKIKPLPEGNYTFHIASNLSLEEESLSKVAFDNFDTCRETSLSILIVRRENE